MKTKICSYCAAALAFLLALVPKSALAQAATEVTVPDDLSPFDVSNAVLATFGPYAYPILTVGMVLAFVGGMFILAQKRTRGIASGRGR